MFFLNISIFYPFILLSFYAIKNQFERSQIIFFSLCNVVFYLIFELSCLFSYAVWSSPTSSAISIITCLFTDFVSFPSLFVFLGCCWWRNFLLSLIFLSPLWGYARVSRGEGERECVGGWGRRLLCFANLWNVNSLVQRH